MRVQLKMESRQTPGFFLFSWRLSVWPDYTGVVFTLGLELVTVEFV